MDGWEGGKSRDLKAEISLAIPGWDNSWLWEQTGRERKECISEE
jgi:hypothetical protein